MLNSQVSGIRTSLYLGAGGGAGRHRLILDKMLNPVVKIFYQSSFDSTLLKEGV